MFRTAILDTDLSGGALVDAVDDILQQEAGRGGAALAYRYSEKPDDDVQEHLWQGLKEGDTLTVVEDDVINGVYAVAASKQGDFAREVLDTVGRGLGVITCDQVRDVISSDVENEYSRMSMLALCNSKEPDAATRDLLLDYSGHDHPGVRRAAVMTMGMLNWPELRDRLAEMRDTDPDERVRELIDFTLEQKS